MLISWYTFFAMKSKHFLLSFLFFFSLVSLADDGSCHIATDSNGRYTIYCSGDGIFTSVEYITNEYCTCSMVDCENIKNDLLRECSDLIRRVDDVADDITGVINNVSNIIYRATNDPNVFTNFVQHGYIRDLNDVQRDLLSCRNGLLNLRGEFDSNESSGLAYRISQIECGDCSSNGGGTSGGSCCDFSDILDSLNDILDLLRTQLDFLSASYDGNSAYWMAQYVNSSTIDFHRDFNLVNMDDTLASSVLAIVNTLDGSLASLNNYSYYLTKNRVDPVYDILHHKSFMYFKPSGTTNYYAYVTNFYLRSALGELSSQDGELGEYTNWFDRVESLLAALVFSDSASVTNIFSGADRDQEQRNQEFLQTMSSVTEGFTQRVKSIEDTSQGILESLRILRSGFSSFSQLPNTVTLAVIPDFTPSESSRSVSNSDLQISFQSSEMIYIVNACRCVTTLAWCIGGVWLLFIFVSWSYKQCYNLAVFVWGVFSSIFKSS